jgi:hypothetical protein
VLRANEAKDKRDAAAVWHYFVRQGVYLANAGTRRGCLAIDLARVMREQLRSLPTAEETMLSLLCDTSSALGAVRIHDVVADPLDWHIPAIFATASADNIRDRDQQDARYPNIQARTPSCFAEDQSDSDGTLTLSGILPGHYRVIAIERGWELEWAKASVLAPFLVKSRQVDVRSNDHLQETIELQAR